MSKKCGKYSKQATRHRGKDRTLTGVLVGIIVFLVIIVIAMLWFIQGQSPYQMIVRDGYAGSQEQWLASLVGEEVATGDVETAYELAVAYGYKESETEWLETLLGTKVTGNGASPYTLACENGFDGTLAEWLTEIADKPEKLGRSDGDGQKTEYELACEYGYPGTFVEWLVSITLDKVF